MSSTFRRGSCSPNFLCLFPKSSDGEGRRTHNFCTISCFGVNRALGFAFPTFSYPQSVVSSIGLDRFLALLPNALYSGSFTREPNVHCFNLARGLVGLCSL